MLNSTMINHVPIQLLFVDASCLITPTQLYTLSSDENSIHFAKCTQIKFYLMHRLQCTILRVHHQTLLIVKTFQALVVLCLSLYKCGDFKHLLDVLGLIQLVCTIPTNSASFQLTPKIKQVPKTMGTHAYRII